VKKNLPHLFWIAGLMVFFCALIYAGVSGAGVPFQDPTSEMRALEMRQNQIIDISVLIGFGLIFSGLAWLTGRAFLHRNQFRKPH
jgi:hypothetical protein